MKNSKADEAAGRFSAGFNCAQAVFSTYSPLLGIPEDAALRIATPFGAGMGRLQEVCGAVTGALMLIGCRFGMVRPDEVETKETAYALVQEFSRRFRGLHGALSCRELLGCDLTTEEGKKKFRELGLGDQVCRACVRDASAIVEEIVLNDRS